jgi:hypothetical protein
MTDDFKAYLTIRRDFNYQYVNHSIGQYVKVPVHTNTTEGNFCLLKGGIIGAFRHISKKSI